MQLIRCTKKLLQELKQKPITNVEPIKNVMGSWHANLFFIERIKCVLVTNDKTLFTLFIPYIKNPDLQNFKTVFCSHLFKNLLHEGFNKTQIEAVMEEHRTIIYSTTNNRNVLGSMNDQKFKLEFCIDFHGGLKSKSIYELNSELNRNMLSLIDYNHPIDKLKEKLQNFI